jgi:hypothetical protein
VHGVVAVDVAARGPGSINGGDWSRRGGRLVVIESAGLQLVPKGLVGGVLVAFSTGVLAEVTFRLESARGSAQGA